MCLIREMKILAAQRGMLLVLRHIRREFNHSADALSNLDLQAFRKHAVAEFGAAAAAQLTQVP